MNSITAWDHLEETVDRLALTIDTLIQQPEELTSTLDYDHVEALADVLEAGHHPDTAARLIHRWALTEPDWDQDAQHAPVISRWLALSVETEGTAPTSQTVSRGRPRPQ